MVAIKNYTQRAGIKCCDYHGNEVTKLVQWDTNRVLTILNWGYSLPPVIHFTNVAQTASYKTTGILSGGMVTFEVPNIMLQKHDTILVFISVPREGTSGLTGAEVETVFKVELPVERRVKPPEYEYSDNAEVCDISAFKVILEEYRNSIESELNRLKVLTEEIDDMLYIKSGDKKYKANMEIINGKPVLIYNEVEEVDE